MNKETTKRYIGVDIGSRFTKIVYLQDKEVIEHHLFPSGIDPATTVRNILAENEEFKNAPICATGYGRKLLNTPYVSEISCHSKGVTTLIPEARLIIDIGGQDSKVMVVDDEGNVADFVMNDKCAAGTGSFFESIARLCSIPIEDIGTKALASQKKLNISSTCVVFAESEVISLINRQHRIEDILMAIHYTVAEKIRNMLSGLMIKKYEDSDKRVVLTGGVANNKAMVYALEKTLSEKITVPPNPSMTGALGAAIFARSVGERK